jgi:hypothetical protein
LTDRLMFARLVGWDLKEAAEFGDEQHGVRLVESLVRYRRQSKMLGGYLHQFHQTLEGAC